MTLTAKHKLDISVLFGFLWEVLVQPAIIMATYNDALRVLVPEQNRPAHMSYGAAICLRLFVGCFGSSQHMTYLLAYVREMNENLKRSLERPHVDGGGGLLRAPVLRDPVPYEPDGPDRV
jgi:hypothetical protein